MKPPMEALDRLEESIKKLRTMYEKYFSGVERTAPERDRDQIKKDINRLLSQRVNNTAWKFRLHSLQATLITHETHWNRITRQIEEGTYHRDLARMQRKQAAAQPPPPPPPPKKTKKPAAAEEPAQKQTKEAAAPKAAAAKKPAKPGQNAAIEKLHAAYNRARQKAGITKPVSLKAIEATVRKQTEAIKQRYKCDRVEFKVALKDGKAILKAVPK